MGSHRDAMRGAAHIAKGQIVSAAASREMVAVLERQQFKDGIGILVNGCSKRGERGIVTLACQQRRLALLAPAVAREVARHAHHPVAGD